MSRTIYTFSLCLYLLCITACSSVRVTTRGAVPVTTIDAEEERSKTFFSLVGTQKSWDEDLCDGAGLAEVSVKPNLLHSIFGVITLGILTPVKVTYKCNETCDTCDN